MRILITGCTGFAGGHLVEALHAPGNVLCGVTRRARPADLLARLAVCDLLDRPALTALLRDVQPEQVYHLAGYPHVGRSFQEADAAWEANLTASRNLFEAVLTWGGQPRIVHVSSGLVYGAPTTPEQRIDEDCPLRPVSPYAASKAAADLAAFQYAQSAGLAIVRVRAFNHIGPRQAPDFAVSSFARQLAAIERGQKPPLLETGDLRPRRDLTDVRDMVRAYVLLMAHGQPGSAYNVGTGQTYAMQDVLDRLLVLARVRVEVREQPRLLRARETEALRADASRLRQATGWEPRYTLEQTLTAILDYWRANV